MFVTVVGVGMPPKLLQEQPLLLEDLLEQEKMEQRRQQQQALLQQKQEQGLLTGEGYSIILSYFIWAILNFVRNYLITR